MKDFEARKNSLCGHLLVKASRLFFTTSINKVITKYDLNLSECHFKVFPYLKAEGSTVTQIAQEMGVSKQAVSKLIAQLIKEKVIYSETSKTDKRQKLIKFSVAKNSSFDWSLKNLEKEEKTFENILGGKKQLAEFKSSLLKIQTHFQGKGI